MKALVTGATGFLGMCLARRLHQTGWDVTAVGRDKERGALLTADGIRFLPLDLGDKEAVLRAGERQQAVFHCAGLSTVWGTYADFYAGNVAATEHMIEAAQRHGAQRFVLVSTPSVYFDYTDRLGVGEDSELPARFANDYVRTKYLAEERVREAMKDGLSAIILRPRALFGPGDRALFPRLMRANRERGIPLIDGGRALLDLTYVDNAAEALICCARAPESACGEVYNISNGEPIRFVDAVNRLFAEMGETPRYRRVPYRTAFGIAAGMEAAYRLFKLNGEPPFTRYSVGVVSRSQTLDIRKAREKLGYEPRVGLQEGFARFAAWWKQENASR
ncbi:MAG: NAD-dependent epimerase/dehydratase family protein [Paenibacillus dendritiformis]|uniref:NAD-dependent epimerase/dehydratase family protein n=1 Tax=Paenibacillus dendritiformis TaxID=130049 RepID=UPI00143CD9A5|nr:NAD-dependent epimerase/dehydratase family protein [Paenibacillus dendritiformis]MDU5144241.1 NAD-dependent epimerase/dehydratase family protein [Paenibacillus dendritiformis]NKI22461.1 NAD-dependent epimerase/dehydratase family protein [Paenibacillus dendritiformis]NRF97501.1 NAD-dependent epimerase/dehydratase family protein [Paenibacillus dendritiformis]